MGSPVQIRPDYGREGYEAGEDDRGLATVERSQMQRALLGRLLSEPETVGAALEAGLLPQHLDGAREQRALRAILGLWGDGGSIDAATVLEWLQKRGQAPAGFDVWLSKVVQEPIRGDVRAYVRIIAEGWRWEVLGQAGALMQRGATERRFTPLEIRTQTVDLLDQLLVPEHTGTRVGDVAKAMLPRLEGKEHTVNDAVRTGLEVFDNITGGLKRGHLLTFAGRSSMGKSALTTAIIDNVAVTQGVPTALWTFEDGREEYTQRILSRRSGVPLRLLDGVAPRRSWPELSEAIADVVDAPLEIFDIPSASPAEIRTQVQRMRAQGIRVVVVDQLDKVDHAAADRHDLRLLGTTSSLKKLAREFQITVILLHQIKRDVDKRRTPRPTMADLYDAPIEKDCDLVGLLYRPGYYAEQSRLPEHKRTLFEVIIGKQRRGPTGTVKLSFDAECARVRDRTPDELDLEPTREPTSPDTYED